MAYAGNSIVDYLKSVGQASDFTSRSKLAQQYGITNYTGTSEQNLNLLGILNKPTTTTTITPSQTQSYQNQINEISKQIQTITPQVQAITAPTATQIQSSQAATSPTLPTPTAPTIKEQYTASSLANLENTKKALEDTYQKQLAATQEQMKQSQAKIDELTTQYKDTLEQAKPLTEPFRANLETSERQRLKVEENYFANQTLVSELETLLTDVNTSLQAEKDITGLASIREPRIAEATNKATARIGVIEATMAARNNQISVAENLIDRTSAAITADRTDKLNYYNTLLSFYDKQLDTEGNKLITLSNDEKTWLKSQVSLLENDLATSQANVENIKQAMQDPDTAMSYAQSGVTLNDTPQEINQKLATYAYSKEVADTSNEMAGKGYTYLVPGQSAPSGTETVSITDSKGNTKQWYKKSEVKTTKSEEPLSILDIQRYQELYPDAGIVAGDTQTIANQKVADLNKPEVKLKNLIKAAKDNGNDYNTILNEIDNDNTISDKNMAKKIASEVYNLPEITPVEQTPIEKEITSLKKSGNLTDGDVRDALKNRGYSDEEITSSSVGTYMPSPYGSKVINSISSFLFGK
jgi:hypothetical protein